MPISELLARPAPPQPKASAADLDFVSPRVYDDLTPKERLFAEGIATGMSNRDALDWAGYHTASPSATAIALKNRENVRLAIKEFSLQLQSSTIADARERQELLTSIMRDLIKKEVVTKKGDVVEVGADFGERMKAVELLGKMQGDFVERHEVRNQTVLAVVQLPAKDPNA